MLKVRNRVSGLLGVAAILLTGSIASAGVTVSTYPDQATWNAVPTITTSLTPQASMTVNQQVAAGNTYAQTFKTGAAGFQLDKIDIYSGGKGGADVRLKIYTDPVGGENTDGFVNSSFSTDLLNGGNGLVATVNGSPGLQYITFDLTGSDEIFFAPNQQYSVELDVLAAGAGQMSWQRTAAAGGYPDGNLYVGATELNFNGTPPANNRGQRNQVGGTPDRDGGMAIYAVGIPEPTSLSLIALAASGMMIRRRRIG
jgi:hypothetical protein